MKYTQVNNKQNKACANNFNDILDQQKQFIDVNKQLQSAVTLTTTPQKPTGKEHPYVQFRYGPQTIFNHNWRKVLGSMNNEPINMVR